MCDWDNCGEDVTQVVVYAIAIEGVPAEHASLSEWYFCDNHLLAWYGTVTIPGMVSMNASLR